MKNKLFFNVLIPLVIPLTFLMVAATPVELLGCRTRGLIAVAIALAGSLAGLACAVKGLIDRIKGNPGSGWWIISTLILAMPVFYIVLFET